MNFRWAVFVLFAGLLWPQPSFDGWVRTLAVEGSPPVVYAGWPIGNGSAWALFRSPDDGGTWLPVYMAEPGLPQPPTRSLVVHPGNPAALFVATDPAHGSILRSSDSGASWGTANTGLPATDNDVQSLFQLRSNPQWMYAQTTANVYKSSDNGRTWARKGALPAKPSLFSINASDPAHMFLATAGGAIYHSSDEGATWQFMSTIPLQYRNSIDSITDLASLPFNSRIVLAAVRGPLQWFDVGSGTQYVAGLQASQDFGATWTNVALETEPYFVYPDPSGRSFVYYTHPESAEVCKATSFSAGTWNCFQVSGSGTVRLWIQPSTPDTMYGGTMYGMYKSTDGAATWRYLEGTVRPTLAKPAEALNFTLVAGTQGYRKVDVKALEKDDWKLPFTASTTDSWLSLDATSGTTPGTVQLSVNASGLAEGSYEGTLRLSSSLAANSTVSVPVRLTVIPPGARGPAYDLTAFAGTGKYGYTGDGGAASAATLGDAAGVALDTAGNVYIADSGNHCVRKVSADGVIRTIAGTGKFGFTGDGGPAQTAQLWRPQGVAAIGGSVYLSDSFNARLRVVDSAGTINTVLSPLTDVTLRWPAGLAVDASGNIFVTDHTANTVVRLAPNGIARTAARFLNQPSDVAIDNAGMLYVADTGSHRILKIDLDGKATVVAGSGKEGFDGDGGLATAASLSSPEGLAVDHVGQVYIADTGNHRIRVVSPQGIIRTVAGTGTAGSSGSGGPASGAQLNRPTDVIVDSSGALYVADRSNYRVVKLTLQAGSGPRITAGGMVNAASYAAQTAPGALFSIFGAELATSAEQAQSLPWPLTLAEASVTVNGRAAPLYYAGPNQINAQVPYETPLGTVQVVVSTRDNYSVPAPLTVNAAAPGIFQARPDWALAQNADYALNGPDNRAPVGSIIVVYLTGQGLLDSPVATGAAAPTETLSRPVLPVSASIGGQPAEVLFLGMTPGMSGLAQANVRIPVLPEGDYPLVLTVGTASSKPALIAVR